MACFAWVLRGCGLTGFGVGFDVDGGTVVRFGVFDCLWFLFTLRWLYGCVSGGLDLVCLLICCNLLVVCLLVFRFSGWF